MIDIDGPEGGISLLTSEEILTKEMYPAQFRVYPFVGDVFSVDIDKYEAEEVVCALIHAFKLPYSLDYTKD